VSSRQPEPRSEAARDAAVRELDRRKPTDEATGRVARLLAEGLSIGEVAERATMLGDTAMLAAARRELAYLVMPGDNGTRNRFAQPGEMGELLRSVDTALAETEIDRGERKALRELVDVAYSSAGVEEAAEVATKTLDDPASVGGARIAYAYVSGETGDAAA
jgi:hypothetical protein